MKEKKNLNIEIGGRIKKAREYEIAEDIINKLIEAFQLEDDGI